MCSYFDRLCRYGEVLEIRRLSYPMVFIRPTNVGEAIDVDRRLIR